MVLVRMAGRAMLVQVGDGRTFVVRTEWSVLRTGVFVVEVEVAQGGEVLAQAGGEFGQGAGEGGGSVRRREE